MSTSICCQFFFCRPPPLSKAPPPSVEDEHYWLLDTGEGLDARVKPCHRGPTSCRLEVLHSRVRELWRGPCKLHFGTHCQCTRPKDSPEVWLADVQRRRRVKTVLRCGVAVDGGRNLKPVDPLSAPSNSESVDSPIQSRQPAIPHPCTCPLAVGWATAVAASLSAVCLPFPRLPFPVP